MEKIQIDIPKGFEVNMELSNLQEGKIAFKEIKKVLTYDDVAKELFGNDYHYYTDAFGTINKSTKLGALSHYPNISYSIKQLESILALNKLCNVAQYFNDGWIPKEGENKWFIGIRFNILPNLFVGNHNMVMYSCVYFKSIKLAEKAIEILGEKEIIKALTLNY